MEKFILKNIQSKKIIKEENSLQQIFTDSKKNLNTYFKNSWKFNFSLHIIEQHFWKWKILKKKFKSLICKIFFF